MKTYEISIQILKIKMSCRTPTSVQFHLEDNAETILKSQLFPLKNGTATPNYKFNIKLDFLPQDFVKQIKIKIISISNKNNAEAGYIMIPVSSEERENSTNIQANIINCKDKTAKIQYSLQAEELKKEESVNKIQQSQNLSSIQQKLGIKFQKSQSLINLQKRNEDSNTRILPYTYSKRKNLNKSRDNRKDTYKSPRHPSSKDGSFRLKKYQNSNSIYSARPVTSQNLNNNESRISQQHYSRLKAQINAQMAQNQALRQMLNNLQWRQRQMHQQCKQSRDQIQKIRQKLHQSELKIIEYQSQLGKRQHIIKQMQNELHKYQDQNQTDSLAINTLSKKIDYKEQHYKTQLAQLTAKYNASVAQKQKSFFQVNEILQKLREIQHKNQIANKQKDMAHLEQKSGLLKKIDALTREISKLKQLSEEKVSDLDDIVIEKKRLQARQKEMESELKQQKETISNLQALLSKQTDSNKVLNRQLLLSSELGTQNSNMKKQIQDLTSQILTLKKQIQTFTKSNNTQKVQIKQLQDKLTKKSQQNIDLDSKNASLTAELGAYKKKQNQLVKQLQLLNSNKGQNLSKIEEYKKKYQQTQIMLRESEKKNEEQRQYEAKMKDIVDKELQEERQKMSKMKIALTDSQHKMKQLSNQKEQKDRKIKIYESDMEKLKNQLAKIKSEHMLLNQDQQSAMNKQKQMQQTIKIKDKAIEEMKKTILKLESVNQQLQESISNNDLKNSERITKEQNMNKYLEGKLQEKDKQILKLTDKLNQKINQNNTLNQNFKKSKQELEYYKTEELGARQANNQNATKIQSLNNQLKSVNQQLLVAKKKLQQNINKNGQLNEKQKKLNEDYQKLQKEYKKYKDNSTGFINRLLKQIENQFSPKTPKSKKNIKSQKNIFDTQLQERKQNLINIISKSLQQYVAQISTLQKEKEALQKNLESSSSNQSKKIQQLESSMNEAQQKIKKLTKDCSTINSQKVEMKGRIEKLDTDKKNIEKQLKEERANKEKQIQRLQSQLQNKASSSSDSIKALKQQIKKIKSQLVNSVQSQKTLSKNLKSTEKQLAESKQIIKNNQISFQAQIQKLNKELTVRQSESENQRRTIAAQVNKINELSKENQQLTKKINENQKRNQLSGSDLKKMQKRISDLEGQLKSVNNQWEQQRNLYIPIGEKFQKLKYQIGRCHTATGQIEKNSKSLLEVSRKRARDDQIIRQSAGQVLRDIQSGLLKLKTKIINKYAKIFDEKEPPKQMDMIKSKNIIQNSNSKTKQRKNSFLIPKLPSNEREQFLYDFRAIQEKLESAIRSYQIMVI